MSCTPKRVPGSTLRRPKPSATGWPASWTSGCEPGSYFELWVSPWGHVRCTCPGFTHRGICKHAEALRTRLAEPSWTWRPPS